MVRRESGIFPYYIFENLAACGSILHFVSSGGKTLGFHTGEPSEQVVANRRELAESVGFDLGSLVVGHQVHGNTVSVAGLGEAGRGACDDESRLPDTDALVTDEENVCLMVMTADCVPVLLYEPERRVVAAIHAGWRGTVAGIVGKSVELMVRRYGCDPSKMMAGIGPSIGHCCFEVGEEVAEAFRPGYGGLVSEGKQAGKFQVDLGEANRTQLLAAGVTAPQIEFPRFCTVCGQDEFFSYRRDGMAAGRFGSGIMLAGGKRDV